IVIATRPLMEMLLKLTEALLSSVFVYVNEPMLMFRLAPIETPSWPATVLSSSSAMVVMAEADREAATRAAAAVSLSMFMFVSPNEVCEYRTLKTPREQFKFLRLGFCPGCRRPLGRGP